MNHVTLFGNATSDPEVSTAGETRVADFAIAYHPGKDKDAQFFKVAAFGETAARVEKNLKKGMGVVIFGRLRQSKWEDEAGTKRSSVDVVADRVLFVPKSTATSAPPNGDDNGTEHSAPEGEL